MDFLEWVVKLGQKRPSWSETTMHIFGIKIQLQPDYHTPDHRYFSCMLTLQSFKSWIVYLLIFKVKLDNYGYNVLLASQGVVRVCFFLLSSPKWGAVVLWAYSSANGAKGREIESPWNQEKKYLVPLQNRAVVTS